MDPGYWHDLVEPVVAGRKVVLTGNPVAGQTQVVTDLRGLGAADVFVLGEGMGTGPEPDCDYHVLDVHGDDILEALRMGQRLLADLPADARAALDAFDPDGDALVIGTFLNELPKVAGRTCLAWRRPEWVALEDKTVVDELWDAAGVDHAPSRVVAVDELSPEANVVWAGDARDGFHGGAELTRWIHNDADAADALATMRAHCDRVRVMPFLEGIPCSIHGVVFRDYVAALRPVEMVVLRRGRAFFYAGAATFWDPPAVDREDMRDIARRVGDELRRRVDFRGAFTVDGVMAHNGFRPTELNPRMGAGLGILARVASPLPLELLNQCIVAGLDLDYRPSDFETTCVEISDDRRGGGTWRAVDTPLAASERALVWRDDVWCTAADADTADAKMQTGPSNIGGFARLTAVSARTPAGPSFAPRAVAFYAYLDREFGTGIGPLEAAQQMRT